METLVASVSLESKRLALEDKSDKTKDPKRPALSVGGCRVEGFVWVKKVGITPIWRQPYLAFFRFGIATVLDLISVQNPLCFNFKKENEVGSVKQVKTFEPLA